MERRIRTLSEILKDVDNAVTVSQVKFLSDELMRNKNKYLVYEVVFGLEHILETGKAIKANMELQKMLNE